MDQSYSRLLGVVYCLSISGACVQLCYGAELEYAKIVKQTFGVPGTPGNPMLGVGSPTLGNDLQKDVNFTEDEMTHTVFVLTMLVLSTIGIFIILIATYFCFSCTTSVVSFFVRLRERRRKAKYLTKQDSFTETSSLESV